MKNLSLKLDWEMFSFLFVDTRTSALQKWRAWNNQKWCNWNVSMFFLLFSWFYSLLPKRNCNGMQMELDVKQSASGYIDLWQMLLDNPEGKEHLQYTWLLFGSMLFCLIDVTSQRADSSNVWDLLFDFHQEEWSVTRWFISGRTSHPLTDNLSLNYMSCLFMYTFNLL